MADLVDQQLDVVRRKLPPDEAERVVTEAIRYLPMEAAEAVTRALAKAARRYDLQLPQRSASSAG